jgi:uncharacterized surface protein with fasciclin (FAS1) repeats
MIAERHDPGPRTEPNVREWKQDRWVIIFLIFYVLRTLFLPNPQFSNPQNSNSSEDESSNWCLSQVSERGGNVVSDTRVQMMDCLHLLPLLVFHSLLLATSVNAGEGGVRALTGNKKCSTIAEIACSTAGFGTLCTAVKAANLDDVLGGKDTFTVFAPTDQAFGDLPHGTLEALLNDKKALTDILLFHAVAGKKVYSKDLECTHTIEMANGKESRTVCRGKGVFQKGAGNPRKNMPRITSTDIEACNGLIHVINGVMLP